MMGIDIFLYLLGALQMIIILGQLNKYAPSVKVLAVAALFIIFWPIASCAIVIALSKEFLTGFVAGFMRHFK